MATESPGVTPDTRDVATSVMPPCACVNLAWPRSGPTHRNANLFSVFAAAQLGIRQPQASRRTAESRAGHRCSTGEVSAKLAALKPFLYRLKIRQNGLTDHILPCTDSLKEMRAAVGTGPGCGERTRSRVSA